MTEGWGEVVGALRVEAQQMHEGREAGLALCRQIIQRSAKCIRHVHRHQFAEAEGLLAEARSVADQARQALQPHPALYYAGYLQDAEKEYVEAAITLAIVRHEPFPTPASLNVGAMAYLHGAGEAASEVRRYALDVLRHGRAEEAEAILVAMETIYDDLITFDYPDGMTGGLRRTTDALRAVIERTRSDLTTTTVQQRLIVELRATQARLESS